MTAKIDKLLVAITLALGAISISTIYAANKSLAINQTIFWLLGLLLLIVISQMYFRTIKSIAIPIYVGALIALVVVFLTGVAIRGSVRWIDFGIFRFQPSEIAKVGSILTLGVFFTKRSAEKVTNLLLSL